MSREELIERLKLSDAIKKYEINSTKSKYFMVDLLKANDIVRFLCALLKISRYSFSNELGKISQNLINEIMK